MNEFNLAIELEAIIEIAKVNEINYVGMNIVLDVENAEKLLVLLQASTEDIVYTPLNDKDRKKTYH